MINRTLLAATAVLALFACGKKPAKDAASEAAPVAATPSAGTEQPAAPVAKEDGVVRPPLDPYPSTYEPYPSQTTLITGATILTATGQRINNGAVLMQDGKIAAVGPASGVTAPSGAVRIDAGGKWVTPGLIDIHSHLGDYPSPSTDSTSDGNEATNPNTAQVWA